MCEILLEFLRLSKLNFNTTIQAHQHSHIQRLAAWMWIAYSQLIFLKHFDHLFILKCQESNGDCILFGLLALTEYTLSSALWDYLVILVHGDKYIDQSNGQPMILKFQTKNIHRFECIWRNAIRIFGSNFIAFHACCAQVQPTFKKKSLKINQLNLELQ